MIDIDKTLYKSTVDAINKLRYLAINDPKTFKSILLGILINDVLEWSLEKEPLYIHDHLIKLRNQLLLCDKAFDIQYIDSSNAYVNVNTPQTNDTWKQLWDNSKTTLLLNDKTTGNFLQCENGYCSPQPTYNRVVIKQFVIKDL